MTKYETLKRPVKWNGKEYSSMSDLARELGVNRTLPSACLKYGHKLKGHYLNEK